MVQGFSASLFNMIRASRHCVAFTGAGVSTLSGIPDFRGPDGLYSRGLSGEVFSIDAFERDPSLFYRKAGPFVYRAQEKEPSVVHIVLARLEAAGFLKALITQNIDMLHQKAGSRRVIEVHGSPAMHYCLHCPGIRVGYDEAAKALSAGGMPRCPRCGRVLKPAITFYGEPLPIRALRQAEEEAESADLMLVLGTSLLVAPAAGLPRSVLRCGGRLVIVNAEPTGLDENAALRFNDLASAFTDLENLMDAAGRF
jgi:NAD-dependent deacetylase